MGVYFKVFTGPVLVCKFHFAEKVEKKTIRFKGCPTVDCKHHDYKNELKAARFCPKCGIEMVMMEREKESRKIVKSPVDQIYELMDQGGFPEDTFEDCWGGLNCEKLIEDHDVFSPSSEEFDALLGREMQSEPRDFAVIVRTPDIAGEIAKCEEFYAKEIAYLRTKYDSVHVEWMVLTTGK
jgi:hypothetical protein